MMHFDDEATAMTEMRRANTGVLKTTSDRPLMVVVDGPLDGDFTVMSVQDAIDNDFLYRWEAS